MLEGIALHIKRSDNYARVGFQEVDDVLCALLSVAEADGFCGFGCHISVPRQRRSR